MAESKTTSQKTPEQIEAALRLKAIDILDHVRFTIEIRFTDPKFQQLLWMAVAEQAQKYADIAEARS